MIAALLFLYQVARFLCAVTVGAVMLYLAWFAMSIELIV